MGRGEWARRAVRRDRVMLRADPASLTEVRRFLRERAAHVDLDDVAAYDLLVAASEAATNVLRHSGSPTMEVGWCVSRGRVEVVVADRGVFRHPPPGHPRRRTPDDATPGRGGGGYGLPLMRALTDEMDVRPGTPRRPGTRVRLVRRLPAASRGGRHPAPARPSGSVPPSFAPLRRLRGHSLVGLAAALLVAGLSGPAPPSAVRTSPATALAPPRAPQERQPIAGQRRAGAAAIRLSPFGVPHMGGGVRGEAERSRDDGGTREGRVRRGRREPCAGGRGGRAGEARDDGVRTRRNGAPRGPGRPCADEARGGAGGKGSAAVRPSRDDDGWSKGGRGAGGKTDPASGGKAGGAPSRGAGEKAIASKQGRRSGGPARGPGGRARRSSRGAPGGRPAP